jgi:hypothetical protein
VKIPSHEEVVYYFAVLEFADALESKSLELKPGKKYDWAIKTENGQVMLRVMDGADELITLSAPAEKTKGVGFASTVRFPGDEADLTIHLP